LQQIRRGQFLIYAQSKAQKGRTMPSTAAASDLLAADSDTGGESEYDSSPDVLPTEFVPDGNFPRRNLPSRFSYNSIGRRKRHAASKRFGR
jgi:hypothetical protein